MKTTYQLQDNQGRVISRHADYDAARTAAEEWAGPDGVVGHDGDLSETGGDRTLIWSDEESAEDDDGANAIGSIRAICDECNCSPCECLANVYEDSRYEDDGESAYGRDE